MQFRPKFCGTLPILRTYLLLKAVPALSGASPAHKRKKEYIMDGAWIGMAAVILGMGVPFGVLYTYYRVRKLRSEERLAGIARGVEIPMEPELTQAARSRRAGLLLV